MKLKKPRKLLPDETIMDGDEFRYSSVRDYWSNAIPFVGIQVKDSPGFKFRTYRPLPKKKEVKVVYEFDVDGPSLFGIYRNGVCIAYSYAKPDAKLICNALNGK